ncbi:hypothetical protein [Salinicoccus roseus]|uniref:hypothetical protein n=1 Tax=Salinicoccus roseus TaxID=45670 RepID=UPI001C52B72A|nr:hypothetical protein [Salinicoccus roseus]
MEFNFSERWTSKKHVNSPKKLIRTADYLRSHNSGISTREKQRMYQEFENSQFYNPRESARDEPLDSMNHRLDGLRYWMFGYYDSIEGEKKFVFSPLGNLFLKHQSDVKKSTKIFTTMLFSLQFPHIGSRDSWLTLNLYPYRLIFSLLNEERLDYKLYYFEIETILVFVKNIDCQIYEELIVKILQSRELDETEQYDILKNNEYSFVTIVYEWEYYNLKLLNSLGVINLNNISVLGQLEHEQKPSSQSPPTKRTANNGYITLTRESKEIIEALYREHSLFDEPLRLDDRSSLSSDIVKEIYMFYPSCLLDQIGETVSTEEHALLRLPKLIEEYSLNPQNSTYDLFEDVLEEAFNLFINVTAEKVSGPGQVDLECIYLRLPDEENEVFAVDGKSTSNKLPNLNAGRLRHHRAIIGAEYTIVVTPRYVPSVLHDIDGENIVILKANTFSEYMYQNIINGWREIDFGEIYSLIQKNMGSDISREVSNLTLSKFGE